jgi:predicted nucleotidyltransferase
MSRSSIIDAIRGQEQELRALGVTQLALFGSAAREDDRPDSDVDVLIDVDFGRPFTFIEYFDVRDRLSAALAREVDVVMRGAVKPRFAERIADDLIPVF